MPFEELLHPRPGSHEFAIPRAGRHRDIELEPLALAGAGFRCRTGPGIKIAAVLVEIGKNEPGPVGKSVIHTVAMMRIDIDIGDALETPAPMQLLDQHTAIVKHTKTGSRRSRSVVQAGDGHEPPVHFAIDDRTRRFENRAHHTGSNLVHARECRRIAQIQVTGAGLRQLTDLRQVTGAVKTAQLIVAGLPNGRAPKAIQQTLPLQRIHEHIVAIVTKWMVIAKTISRDLLANRQAYPLIHRPLPHIPQTLARTRPIVHRSNRVGGPPSLSMVLRAAGKPTARFGTKFI